MVVLQNQQFIKSLFHRSWCTRPTFIARARTRTLLLTLINDTRISADLRTGNDIYARRKKKRKISRSAFSFHQFAVCPLCAFVCARLLLAKILMSTVFMLFNFDAFCNGESIANTNTMTTRIDRSLDRIHFALLLLGAFSCA